MDANPTVAACQLPVDDLDPGRNLVRIGTRLAGVDCDVALFPELSLTGFVADDRLEAAALRPDGPIPDRVRARALDGVRWVVACGRTGTKTVDGDAPSAYAGRSLAARPDGVVAAELAYEPDDLVVTLDSDVLDRQREVVGVPVTRDSGD